MRIAILAAASLLLLSSCTASLPATTANTATPAPAPASAPSNQNLNQYLEQGIAFTEKGQFQEAIDALTQYIKYGGKSAAAFYYRGVACNNQRMFDQALADLSKAVELNNRHADAYYERSKTYAYKNNWDKAVTDSTKVLQIDPQFAPANYIRAIAGIKEKEYDKAIKDLEITGNIDADDDKWPDLKNLTDLAIPLNELVLLKVDLTSKKTGTCFGGICSAPISYNITVRVIMFANPDKPGIQVIGANISPAISWLSEVQLRGSIYKLGMETMATNLAAAQAVSDAVSCSVIYKAGSDSKARESITVMN